MAILSHLCYTNSEALASLLFLQIDFCNLHVVFVATRVVFIMSLLSVLLAPYIA